MARMVATKAALSIRIDALSDADSRSDAAAAEVGVTNRVKLESRLRALEHRAGIQSVRRVTTGTARPTPRWEMNGAGATNGYNNANDSVKLENGVREMLPTQPVEAVQAAVQAVVEVKEEKKREKEERRKEKKEKRKSVGPVVDIGDVSMGGDDEEKPGETKEERKARKEAKKAVSVNISQI